MLFPWYDYSIILVAGKQHCRTRVNELRESAMMFDIFNKNTAQPNSTYSKGITVHPQKSSSWIYKLFSLIYLPGAKCITLFVCNLRSRRLYSVVGLLW